MEWKLFGFDLEQGLRKMSRQHKQPSRTVFAQRTLSPARDWLLLLVAAIVLGGAIALYDGSLFLAINSGSRAGSPTSASGSSKLNEELLTATLNAYRERDAAASAMRVSPPTLADPAQ